MSNTLYLNAYFALEAPRTVFWTPVEGVLHTCSKDRDHQLPENAKFCPECAGPVATSAVEHAAPALAVFAEELGVTPEIAFRELLDPDCGWFWTADSGAQLALTIRWHPIELEAGKDRVMGLGFKIGHEPYLAREAKQLVYSLAELAPYHIALLEVANKFSITSDPKLYLQIEQHHPWDSQ